MNFSSIPLFFNYEGLLGLLGLLGLYYIGCYYFGLKKFLQILSSHLHYN